MREDQAWGGELQVALSKWLQLLPTKCSCPPTAAATAASRDSPLRASWSQ